MERVELRMEAETLEIIEGVAGDYEIDSKAQVIRDLCDYALGHIKDIYDDVEDSEEEESEEEDEYQEALDLEEED